MRKEKFHNQGLSFYCNQSISDFEKKDNNLNCQLCSKNIIDFRYKTKSEYNTIVKSEKDVCGIFYANQIGDEIDIIINWKTPFFYFGFLSSLLLSKPLLAQDSTKVKTEITDSVSLSTQNPTDSTTACQKTKTDNLEKDSKIELSHYQKRKRRLYVSKRFPFVHYDRKKPIVLAGKLW